MIKGIPNMILDRVIGTLYQQPERSDTVTLFTMGITQLPVNTTGQN